MPKMFKSAKTSKSRFHKTFTACWTCRARSVRCDQAVPHCGQCKRRGLVCEGYHIRLVWVDNDTGSYAPMQRRAYACELTWKDYPAWTLKEVGHLIETCDQEPEFCRCGLHHCTVANPFQVFPQMGDFSSEHVNESVGDVVDSNPSDNEHGDAMLQLTYPELDIEPLEPADEHMVQLGIPLDRMFAAEHLRLPPYQPLMPRGTHYENHLFHHYLLHMSGAMLPVDVKDSTNPWRSAYPLMAAQNTTSSRSLYYAMLAQSAHHLGKLKGVEHGQQDEIIAMNCFGMALRELRQTLKEPTQDYSSVLAAILTITSTEHVFRSSSQGWRGHFRAATRFVMRHLARRPWKLTYEAWAVTQSFVLSHVIAHTAHKPYTLTAPRSHDEDDDAEDDNAEDVYDVLCDAAAYSSFGYTIGSTGRLIKALYHVRRLEAQMAVETAGTTTTTSAPNNVDTCITLPREAIAILDDLQTLPDDGLDAYLDSADGVLMPLGRARTLATLHINLFRNAVGIHLLSTVLRLPPSTVAGHVWDVLSDAWAFVDMSPHGTTYCSLSLWPLFVAAVDAYLPEAQAMAERILDFFAKTSGVKNRRDVKRLVHEVWAIRIDLAQKRKCGPGDVWIDWREVMDQMDMDILLL